MPPAARAFGDTTAHGLPPTLVPGPGAPTVMIGFLPAWRAVPLAAAAGLQAAKTASDTAVTAAESATKAAAGTPGAPAALAAEQTLKASMLASLGASFAATGADIHMCTVPSPVPPHGPGVDVKGSATVSVCFFPAGRMGDTIIEPLGPTNTITSGQMNVMIGG